MYGPKRLWGTNLHRSSETSKTWYLGEGCTNGGFESWILGAEPDNSDADIQLTYMTPEGEEAGTVPLHFLQTPGIASTWQTSCRTMDVSTVVTAKFAGRCGEAVYWNGRKGAHDSVGVTAPHDNLVSRRRLHRW